MALVDSIFALIAFAFLIYAIVEGVRAFKPGSSSQTNAPGSNPGTTPWGNPFSSNIHIDRVQTPDGSNVLGQGKITTIRLHGKGLNRQEIVLFTLESSNGQQPSGIQIEPYGPYSVDSVRDIKITVGPDVSGKFHIVLRAQAGQELSRAPTTLDIGLNSEILLERLEGTFALQGVPVSANNKPNRDAFIRAYIDRKYPDLGPAIDRYFEIQNIIRSNQGRINVQEVEDQLRKLAEEGTRLRTILDAPIREGVRQFDSLRTPILVASNVKIVGTNLRKIKNTSIVCLISGESSELLNPIIEELFAIENTEFFLGNIKIYPKRDVSIFEYDYLFSVPLSITLVVKGDNFQKRVPANLVWSPSGSASPISSESPRSESTAQSEANPSNESMSGIPLGPTEPGVTYIPPTNPDQGKMAIKKTLIFLKTFKKLKKDTDKEKYLQKYADTLLALLVQCKSFCLSVSNQKVLYNWNAFYRLWHDQSYQGEQLSISKFSANVPQLIEHLSNIQEEVKRMS